MHVSYGGGLRQQLAGWLRWRCVQQKSTERLFFCRHLLLTGKTPSTRADWAKRREASSSPMFRFLRLLTNSGAASWLHSMHGHGFSLAKSLLRRMASQQRSPLFCSLQSIGRLTATEAWSRSMRLRRCASLQKKASLFVHAPPPRAVSDAALLRLRMASFFSSKWPNASSTGLEGDLCRLLHFQWILLAHLPKELPTCFCCATRNVSILLAQRMPTACMLTMTLRTAAGLLLGFSIRLVA